MVDEMLIAGGEWLPQYADEIELAKERMASGNLIPPKTLRGNRVKEKTVEDMKK